MSQKEFVAAVAEETGFTKADAQRAVGAVIDVIRNTLAEGGDVSLAGLGKFSVRARPARIGHNPRTGEQIQIKAKRAPIFSAAKALKDAAAAS